MGALIKDIEQPILLVAPKGREEEVIIRLSRVGFDNTLGYLDGSFESWQSAGKEIDTLRSVSAEVLATVMKENKVPVFDIRKPGEYANEHLVDAPSAPLDYLNSHLKDFPVDEDFYLHCAGGYRSVIASSILKARGIHNVIDVAGGYGAIKHTDIPRTTVSVCPSTLK